MVLLATDSLVAGNYIGVERCKSCHEFEFSRWAAGPHAHGHESLTAKPLGASKCNTCHTMDPSLLVPRFIGIQCERCHGGGKYYHLDHVMRDRELARAVGLIDVTEAHCRQCHTAGTPSIRPFDFAAMMWNHPGTINTLKNAENNNANPTRRRDRAGRQTRLQMTIPAAIVRNVSRSESGAIQRTSRVTVRKPGTTVLRASIM